MNRHFLSFLEKARQGLADNTAAQVSDREFSRALGLNDAAINQWRKRGIYPSDETMLKLADYAGMNRWKALMLLNYLRAPNDDVKQTYFQIYKNFKSVIILIAATCAFSLPSNAATKSNSKLCMPEPHRIILQKILHIILIICGFMAISSQEHSVSAAPALSIVMPASVYYGKSIIRFLIRAIRLYSLRFLNPLQATLVLR